MRAYIGRCKTCKAVIKAKTFNISGFCSVDCKLMPLIQNIDAAVKASQPKQKTYPKKWRNPSQNEFPGRAALRRAKKKGLRAKAAYLAKENATLKEHLRGSRPQRTGFYASREWLELRMLVIKKHVARHGRRCLACFRDNVVLHVDHVKPRSRYPSLELVESNLQVLCEDCNLGKGAWDETDWRRA